MRREQLTELHYITPLENVPSILKNGLLSHQLAEKVSHKSVAMTVIQDKRAKVTIPGGRKLHEYVNLYICARNPMLYKLHSNHANLAVIRVSTDVLDIPKTVIADGNASSDYTIFLPSPIGLKDIDYDLVFAEYWTDPDPIEKFKKGSAKCAEVLVPDRVPAKYIVGAYASCGISETHLRETALGDKVIKNPNIFFR